MSNLQFIPSAGKSGAVNLGLDDISDEVKADVEEVYTILKTNAGRMRVEKDSPTELQSYLAQVKAYCLLREAGQLYFRKSPVAKASPTVAEFRITDMSKTENEQKTDDIREAVDKVKATAAKK